MSDGPHRSLKMRPSWKKVAEFADKHSFTQEEVGNAACVACSQDWRADVPDTLIRGVCEILGGQQDSLFRDQKVIQLESLRRIAAGHGLGQVLIDCAIHQTISGQSGPDGAVEAASQALAIWCSRHSRQIEEIYCRESTERRAQNVRTRIEEGIGNAARHGLARQLLNLEKTPAPRTVTKQTGLDDGVHL
jgi:hypothetical protein